MRENEINKAFGRTMMWLLLVVVTLFATAGIVKCAKTSDRPRETVDCDGGLETLEDSIHYYEDGF